MDQALIARATAAFRARYGAAPQAVATAPGRVNLMGEHTDYNGGVVLPVTLGMGLAVALGPSGVPGAARLVSDGFDGEERRSAGDPATGGWADYAFGSLESGAPEILRETGLNVMIVNDLPAGAGLSSSAAIEVAVLRACAALTGSQPDPVSVALAARAVENGYVGMPCGVMDQFAVSVGQPGTALFLDTARLIHRTAPLLPGHAFCVIHSGVGHKLADDGYATRVAECTRAADALGVDSLSALGSGDRDRIDALPEPLNRRARHIFTENARVHAAVAALEAGDAAAMGALMCESHRSQAQDYAVSVPAIDRLVDTAMTAGALGARLTGGGFGGSGVILVRTDEAAAVTQAIATALPETRPLATITPAADPG